MVATTRKSLQNKDGLVRSRQSERQDSLRSQPDLEPPAYVRGQNRSVARALALLRDVAQSKKALSFSEIQRRHRLAKGTLHNLLATLEAGQFVYRSPQSGHYLVGFSVKELAASSAAGVTELGEILAPILEPLVDECRETCHLGFLSGFEELIVRRIDHSSQVVQVAPLALRRHLAHSSAGGLATLALLDPEDLKARLPETYEQRTRNTISSRRALLKRLEVVRSDGYCLDMEEAYVGVRCVAVAVVPPGWPPISLSFTLPLQRADPRHLTSLVRPLKDAARRITAVLSVTPLA